MTHSVYADRGNIPDNWRNRQALPFQRAQVGAEVEEGLERQRIVLRRKLGMD